MIKINIRKNWIQGISSQYYSVENTIEDVKSNFDVRRYYSVEGSSVEIDGVVTQVIIQSYSNPLNQGKYDRKIHMPIETVVTTGSLVEWESNIWLITSNIDDLQSYKSASMVECNNTLSFYSTTDSSLYSIPCIISSKLTLKDESSQYISSVDNQLYLIISNTTTNKEIQPDMIFKIGVYNYQISSVFDDISNPGLLIFKLSFSETEATTHTYTVTIQNPDTTLYVNDTLTLDIIATDNSQQVTSPTLTYSSSDTDVATVSNGIVTCIAEGTAVITVTFNSITDTLNLTVQNETITDDYSVLVTGATTVKLGANITLNASVYNNGVLDTSEGVTWTFSNQDSSSNIYCTLVSSTSTSLTLKATSNSSYVGEYVVVRGTKSDDSSVYKDFVVQIKSLF